MYTLPLLLLATFTTATALDCTKPVTWAWTPQWDQTVGSSKGWENWSYGDPPFDWTARFDNPNNRYYVLKSELANSHEVGLSLRGLNGKLARSLRFKISSNAFNNLNFKMQFDASGDSPLMKDNILLSSLCTVNTVNKDWRNCEFNYRTQYPSDQWTRFNFMNNVDMGGLPTATVYLSDWELEMPVYESGCAPPVVTTTTKGGSQPTGVLSSAGRVGGLGWLAVVVGACGLLVMG